MKKQVIEYRAWDIANKQMLTVKYLRWLANGNIASIGCGDETGFQTRLRPRDCELMRFTSLHDKSGRKVYEEDIVRSGEFVWAMVWENAINDLEVGMVGFSGRTIYPSENWEVIGNIYENPELLIKEEK